jgi:hypothetical protein
MGGNAIKLQLRFGKRVFDFLGRLKAFVRMQHVVRRLGAGSTRLFGVFKKLGEAFRAVLRAFNTGMETILGHNGAEELAVGLRKCNPNLTHANGMTKSE